MALETGSRHLGYTGPLKAAILDWAGTGVDYGCMGPAAVFVDVFKRRGVDITISEARTPMGLAKKEHIRFLTNMPAVAERWRRVHGRLPNEDDVDDMYPETETMMIKALNRHCDPIPGAVQALHDLRAQGLKIGSCTGYTRPMMDVLVPAAAEQGYKPDVVVCASDVPSGRPTPFMAWLNAIQLGVYPAEAVVKIGDTEADILEGLNAGMWTIGLTKTGNELGLTQAEAESLPPEELRQRLNAIESRFLKIGAHYVAQGIWECPGLVDAINHRLSQGETP